MIDHQTLATEMNLTVLIEVHDLDNLMRVRDQVVGFPHRSYSLLGINNRDLRTMKTDLGTTLRMAELVEDRGVLVAESGINTREDVKKLAEAGVRAALVGESLMRSDDIVGKVREMFGARKLQSKHQISSTKSQTIGNKKWGKGQTRSRLTWRSGRTCSPNGFGRTSSSSRGRTAISATGGSSFDRQGRLVRTTSK